MQFEILYSVKHTLTVFIKILPLDIYSTEESQNIIVYVCRSNRSILLVGFKPELMLRLQARHFNDYSCCYYSFLCLSDSVRLFVLLSYDAFSITKTT
jgi:hypothetical protein